VVFSSISVAQVVLFVKNSPIHPRLLVRTERKETPVVTDETRAEQSRAREGAAMPMALALAVFPLASLLLSAAVAPALAQTCEYPITDSFSLPLPLARSSR
jgi:hypothetical protein